MIEVTIRQARGKLKILFAGTYPEAKTWARQTFVGATMWFRDADWRAATDEQLCYHQVKAGFPGYPGVERIAGPVAARFFAKAE